MHGGRGVTEQVAMRFGWGLGWHPGQVTREPQGGAGTQDLFPVSQPAQPGSPRGPEPTLSLECSVLPLTKSLLPSPVSFQFKYPNCLLAEIN